MPSIRNVANIAHVDHGKTTLVDQLLYQSGQFRDAELDKLAGGQHGLIMDSGDLERERGITILAKNCALTYEPADGSEPVKINLIDTPGHADFGGEVERVLQMADGVLLLVDAFEGPMPQTRFVLEKALGYGLRPIVVVNKTDRPDARPDKVIDEVFDLLGELDAEDEALDFPAIYASARDGWAVEELEDESRDNLRPVFEAICEHVPAPEGDPDAPLRMLVTNLDHTEYVGRIAIGRITAGTIEAGQPVSVVGADERVSEQRVLEVLSWDGLQRKNVESAVAGDVVALVGLDPVEIGDSICDREKVQSLPRVAVDEPTLHMTFRVNDSPFAGQEGDYVTSRQIGDRLQKELRANVALRVEDGDTPESFRVSGRGLMHIGILIETMRREGFELAVGRPKVIFKEEDGKRLEPVEQLVVDCPAECQSSVMSLVTERRAEVVAMDPKPGASGFVHMVFTVPARGLIGLRPRMLTATSGRAIMHHTFERYEPVRGEIAGRANGVMIATEMGQVTAYALDKLYDRGMFFVKPGQKVYGGQVVGEHNRDNDLTVNVTTGKKLTNVRAAGRDDAAQVRPAREMSLEQCLEYIEDDELVEVTPAAIRMRKRLLSESDRKRASRA
ncbi:MAG: translational GTPase TypA [Phycisphaeraceae bacterium]|nr:translational GTPase TypA [Phycisphaeraceae bacterium]